MRFHWGKFPDDNRFNPDAEGWVAIPETKPSTIQLLALSGSAGLFLLWLPLAFLAFPLELLSPHVTQISPTEFQIRYPIGEILTGPVLTGLIVVLILFIPTHEFLHALCCPGWGLSSSTYLGLWLSKGFIYIHHEGPMHRNRFLLVLIVPYLALSLLPLLLMILLKYIGWTPEIMVCLGWLSLLGSISAGGDFVSAWSLLTRIPKTAVVRNKDHRSYWKLVDRAFCAN